MAVGRRQPGPDRARGRPARPARGARRRPLDVPLPSRPRELDRGRDDRDPQEHRRRARARTAEDAMRFELTDDQQAIQRTAKEFLASRYPAEEVRRLALEDERGFTEEQWHAIAELGWPALVVPEDDGGLGLGVVELAVLQEQLGYALAPTPLLSTVAAALAIAAAGDATQRSEWLPALAEGERRGTIAPLPPRGGLQGGDAGDGALTATLEAVPDAAGADLLVVPTGHERLTVVDLGAAGVTVEPVDGL